MAVQRFKPEMVMCGEKHPSCVVLRRALDDFYARATDYTAFHKVTHKPEIWAPIVGRIRSMHDRRDGPVRVMEFGAGMTGFPGFLDDDLRAGVHFTAQDVTAQNQDHLRDAADEVVVGTVADTEGPFDVIFSTFVWEHVTNPRETLDLLLERLAPGGSMFIACPRYETPGYTPPSARHYSASDRVRLMLWLRSQRARARSRKEPLFLIHNDPALLHTDWYRDADAIHWVSRKDLELALPEGYELTDVPYGQNGGGLKGYVFRRFLLLFVEVRAPA